MAECGKDPHLIQSTVSVEKMLGKFMTRKFKHSPFTGREISPLQFLDKGEGTRARIPREIVTSDDHQDGHHSTKLINFLNSINTFLSNERNTISKIGAQFVKKSMTNPNGAHF